MRGRLFFSCLVTKICRHARVVEKRSDPIISEIAVLDECIFARSITQVRRAQAPPPPQPSFTQGEAAPSSFHSIPFDPSLVDPNTHAMIQHYHGLTMDRLVTMEALIRQITLMMSWGDHNGDTSRGYDEGGHGDAI